MPDNWYPPPDAYYVPAQESAEYPLRQGDLVGPVAIDGITRSIVQLVHPTCELSKAGVDRLQVCMVEPLDDLADDFQRGCVVAGMRESIGRFEIALAHTFFLSGFPPARDGMFANFRRLHLVDRTEVSLATRQAALTHDCRAAFIRRWFYFRFRILLSLDAVRALEAERIRADPAFEGPRPPWAQ